MATGARTLTIRASPPGISLYSPQPHDSDNGPLTYSQTEVLQPLYSQLTKASGHVPPPLILYRSKPPSSLCNLKIYCIVSGIIVVALGMTNLYQLTDLPSKFAVMNGTCGIFLFIDDTMELDLNRPEDEQTMHDKLTTTNYTAKCDTYRVGASTAVCIYAVIATSAGVMILIGGIKDKGGSAAAGAVLLILSLPALIVQTVILHKITPGRDLDMFQEEEKKIYAVEIIIPRVPTTLTLPPVNEMNRARNYLKGVWMLGRAREILTLVIAGLLNVCFSTVAFLFTGKYRTPEDTNLFVHNNSPRPVLRVYENNNKESLQNGDVPSLGYPTYPGYKSPLKVHEGLPGYGYSGFTQITPVPVPSLVTYHAPTNLMFD